MLVSREFLNDSNHGAIGCADCHGGDKTKSTRREAHVGLVADPTKDGTRKCATCHQGIATLAQHSMHTTLAGIRGSLEMRSGQKPLSAALQTGFNNHCSRCHGGCGDCHLRVPGAAGGGLLAQHRIRKTPPMTLVCTACHGSRVGDEYRGENPGVPADAHYNKGMQCTACHTGAEMHGQGAQGAATRYDVTSAPDCGQCHPDDASFRNTTAHEMHRDAQDRLQLQCQVCHSNPYKHCYSCHVSLEQGKPVYEVNAPSHESPLAFKIGKNPLQSERRPEKWVVLRHATADPANFDHYGAGLQPAFNAQPTWRFATPHNIQRRTAQNAGCNTCHGHRELFLAPSDLKSYEVDANSDVVVSDAEMP